MYVRYHWVLDVVSGTMMMMAGAVLTHSMPARCRVCLGLCRCVSPAIVQQR